MHHLELECRSPSCTLLRATSRAAQVLGHFLTQDRGNLRGDVTWQGCNARRGPHRPPRGRNTVVGDRRVGWRKRSAAAGSARSASAIAMVCALPTQQQRQQHARRYAA